MIKQQNRINLKYKHTGLPDCIQENLLKKAAPAVNTHTDEVPVSGRE